MKPSERLFFSKKVQLFSIKTQNKAFCHPKTSIDPVQTASPVVNTLSLFTC